MSTGMSSCRKETMLCGFPSSSTVNELLSRLVTICCLSSTTVAWSTTSSTSLRKTKTPLSSLVFGCSVEAGGFRGALPCGGGEGCVAGGFGVSCADDCASPGTLTCVPAQITNVRRRKTRAACLLRRRIITRPGIHLERWQSFRWHQRHFYLTPFAIPNNVLRPVSQHVLVTEFDANLGGDIRQIIGILDGESASSGQFRDFRQQSRSQPLFRRCEVTIIDSYGVDHYIRFLHQRLNFAFGVATVVVASVRDDQQRFLRILRLPHFADAHVDRIEQSCALPGDRVHQLALNIVHRTGEVGHLFRGIRKGDHKKFI